jgi:uncharacterized protein (DUF2252 family)
VLKPGQQASLEDVQAHVKTRLAPYKYPRWIAFVPELPKTATGKIQRFKLRAQAGCVRESHVAQARHMHRQFLRQQTTRPGALSPSRTPI